MKEKKEKNQSVMQDKKENIQKKFSLHSIRMKLIILGVVSLISTIVLGIIATVIVNQNHRDSELLKNINEVNRIQNHNSTLDVWFLYELDNKYNSEILGNLNQMKTGVENAEKNAGKTYFKTLKSMEEKIEKNIENMKKLEQQMKERGFKSDQGKYVSFMEGDKTLEEFKSRLEDEPDWQDGKWTKQKFSELETKKIDGKDYKYFHYEDKLPVGGKRNNIIVRIGAQNQNYSGKIHIVNIKLDHSVQVDLSKITVDKLGYSFGTAYDNLQVGTFNRQPEISLDGTYTAESGEFQESSISIPVKEYDIQKYKKVSVDVYFEQTSEDSEMQISVASNERYKFDTQQEKINTGFQEYSKKIAEGKDASDLLKNLKNESEEAIKNAELYVKSKEIAKIGKEGFQKKRDTLEEIEKLDVEIQKLKAENNELNDSLTKLSNEIKKKVNEASEQSANEMKAGILIVLICTIICVGLLNIYVVRSIQTSIRRFRVTLREITDGNIRAKAKIGKGDEFDVFGESLNHMTEKLSETLGNVNEAAKVVQQGGSELQIMAEDTNQISNKVETSVSEIAQGAVSQAKEIEDSNNHVNHLSDLMSQMVTNVDKLDSSSEDIEQASKEAVTILNRLNESNGKMTDGIHQIVEQIRETNESVEQIGEAVSLISSIASQTNLLSLNASIEAARAGEAGKGFSIVATEISQLADQSDQSADKIQNVIENLSVNFKQIVDMMQRIEEFTREQNDKLSDTQKQFHIVNDCLGVSRKHTDDIKIAIEECSRMQEQVGQIMENLSAISQENAAASTETEEVMKKLDDTIKKLLTESQKMSDLSTRLEKDLHFFKL